MDGSKVEGGAPLADPTQSDPALSDPAPSGSIAPPSDESGMITPTGAVAISVYRAIESMRFAGSVGALSQSPDSYRPVQKTKSLTTHPTTQGGLMYRSARPTVLAARESTAALHRFPYGMPQSLRQVRMRPAVTTTGLRPASS